MPLYARLEPTQFIPAKQGAVSLTITNLDGAAHIYLHKEYEFPLRGWDIAPGANLPNFLWDGGLLWISASANGTPYQVMVVEPSRGAAQAGGGGGGGGGGGNGGGGGGGGGRTGPPRGRLK